MNTKNDYFLAEKREKLEDAIIYRITQDQSCLYAFLVNTYRFGVPNGLLVGKIRSINKRGHTIDCYFLNAQAVPIFLSNSNFLKLNKDQLFSAGYRLKN